MSTTTKRLDALLKQRADALRARIVEAGAEAEPVDGDWQPTREWAARWGVSIAQTQRLIDRGLRAGLMEGKQGRWKCSNGARVVPLYREAK